LSDYPAYAFEAGTWQIVYANEPALLLYEYSFSQFLRLQLDALFASEQWPQFQDRFSQEFSDTRRFAVRRLGKWTHRTENGHLIEVQMALNRVHIARAHMKQDLILALVFHRSIARFRVPTQSWRRLSHDLDTRLEEERREIADKLYQKIAQDLAAMKFQLKGLERWLSGVVPLDARDAVAGQMETVYQRVEDILKDTHETAARLRPALLDDFGLKSAMENHLRLYEQQTGQRVRLRVVGNTKILPLPLQTALFRILQEALENVHRHARANLVTVDLAVQNDDLTLIVTDNGRGMTLEKLDGVRPASVGILSMQEHARKLGGNFKIEAAAGGGTRVEVAIPLVPPKA
jgi:signal transduction histidine kinase